MILKTILREITCKSCCWTKCT